MDRYEQLQTAAELQLNTVRDYLQNAVASITKEAMGDIPDLSVLDEIKELADELYCKSFK